MVAEMKGLIPEVHTTHLTERCARKVQLTAQGKRIGEMPGALYRGCLIHETFQLIIARGCRPESIPAAVIDADAKVSAQAKAENRPLTQSVIANRTDTMAEVQQLAGHFLGRFAGMIRAGKVIGCELPIRWSMDVDGEPVSFATHLDFLWIDGNGTLVLWDFKSQQEAPTWDFLGRNLQFGLMWLMVRHGSVCIDADLGIWESMGMFPDMAWIHVNDLAPYGRKTTTKDDDGTERVFAAGEHRPMDRIVRGVNFRPEHEAAIREEISLRVRMQRAGFYPTSPDEVGCSLCECRTFCTNWTREERSNG